MPEKYLRLRPDLRAAVIEGEGVLLTSDFQNTSLYGKVYTTLIPLLSGSYTPEEILSIAARDHGHHKTCVALIKLRSKGYLCDSFPKNLLGYSRFWSEHKLDPCLARSKHERSSVYVKLLYDSVNIDELRGALIDFGCKLSPREEDATIVVVVVADYLDKRLELIAAEFFQSKKSWLLINPCGRRPLVGPLYDRKSEGCHACVSKQLRRQRQIYEFAQKYQCRQSRHVESDDARPVLASSSIAMNIASLEFAKYIAGGEVSTRNQIISFDSKSNSMNFHSVLRDPNCKICGSSGSNAFAPVVLNCCPISYQKDGGMRSMHPSETWEKIKHLVSPISGIVEGVHPIHSSVRESYVYIAGHNSAQMPASLNEVKRNLRSCSAGKGASKLQAKVSAMCEAIERYSAERHGREIVEIGSYRNMRSMHGDLALHPNKVMLFSDRQFEERDKRNLLGSVFNYIPDKLDYDDLIEWTPVWSLTNNNKKFLPTELLFLSRRPSIPDEVCNLRFNIAIGCSNGNASGNTLEEAILQGVLELIERDSVAIWWYNRLQMQGIDLASSKDEWILKLVEGFHRIGRNVWALNLTTDLSIPCVAAFSSLDGKKIIMGFGCHLDFGIALQRALSEMNQMLSIAESTPRDECDVLEDRETLDWLKNASVENQRYLLPSSEIAYLSLSRCTSISSGDLMIDIDMIKDILRGKSMEILVLDQTQGLVGMPVVKVLVPGLRHFWARFAQGRLYQVPFEMGFVKAPTQECDLNPISVFF